MWKKGEITVIGKTPIIRAKDGRTAVRSERGACAAESVSATMVGAGTVGGGVLNAACRSSYAVTVGQ